MKSLTDEQKKKMWEHIREAILSSGPRDGEYLVTDLMDLTGLGRNRLLSRLDKLIDAEIIGKRRGTSPKGISCNIYFPLKEASLEEIIEVLTS